ncbi:MAG: PEP-utilizing enzyme [Patescibacteria group bacterium]|nr:PEP-utilizing enzyme [Patescibacteria group bacterium]
MKSYYTGIRNFHFYLLYIAHQSYLLPDYQKGYAKIGDLISVVKNSQGRFNYLYQEKDPDWVIRFYIEKPKAFPGLIKDLEIKKRGAFKKYGEKFKLEDLKKLKVGELLKIYNEFFSLMKRFYYLNQVVWFLDISGYQFLKDNLLKQNFTLENINLLTQPDRRNYLEKEKEEFLKLCLKYFKNRKKINLGRLLENHLKKFAYVGVSYYKEPPRQKKDYLEQIERYKKEKRNWRYFTKVLEERRKDFKIRIKTRDRMSKKIKDARLKKAILVMRQAAWGKDYFRGSISEIVYYYFDALANELARRLKIKNSQIKILTDKELNGLAVGKRLDWKKINLRRKYYAIGTFNHKFFLYYGRKARRIENKYFAKPKGKEIGELKGVSAQKGIARGKAKIILSYNDFKKFKDGDILIATNTMPEYMPVIRKAGAIVTEIGGVTCHAAVVARELKKPCLIGVASATAILKDGDKVEVDADKGIVRKL